MLIIVLINIAIIICIYLRYYNFPENIKNTKENIEEIDPIVMGYINDRNINNNYDLILAEIVNLNIKKYIIIEYDEKDKSKYHYTIKQNFYMEKNDIEKYDLVILDFLFSQKTEITRSELEQKIIDAFASYNVQYNELQKVLQQKLIEQSIIDTEKQEELTKFPKIYKRFLIITIALFLILEIFTNIKISLVMLVIYIIEIMVTRILLLKASRYTIKGEVIRNNIIKYKSEIENKEFLVNKKEMNEVIFEKEFANSLALHISTDAKESFITGVLKNAVNMSKKAVAIVSTVIIIMILAGIILQKITLSIGKDGILLLYIFLALIVATVADISFAISAKKQK